MYALSVDMVVSDLRENYGEPYNRAYFEIKQLLKANGFEWVQGSTYLSTADDFERNCKDGDGAFKDRLV